MVDAAIVREWFVTYKLFIIIYIIEFVLLVISRLCQRITRDARMPPSLSTDQLAAFVQLAESGSLRAAADVLHISEQGVRNRLVALEQRLGVELYRKRRGVRRATPLTEKGRRFLPHATALLEQAVELCEMFDGSPTQRSVHVVASEYLSLYVLVDAVARFHAENPEIHIRLSTRTEQQIENAVQFDPSIAVGVAAPYEPSPELDYTNLFSMDWSLITPRRHRLAKRERVRLKDLQDEPMILFERGSTGRQHVMDGFHDLGLSPRIDMEATSTELIVRMVQAGLGISIVPLLPNGTVTRGRKIAIHQLGKQIRPIHSGILTRKGERLSQAARCFVDFVRSDSQQEIG